MTLVHSMSAPLSTAVPDAPDAGLHIVDPLSCPGWDALLATHSDSGFFHGAAWAKTLADAYGFRCRYVVAARDRELCGLLPVIEARSWLRGMRGVSLPFADECPPLLSSGIGLDSLFNRALQDGAARGWKYLELRGGLESLPGMTVATSYYGHRLLLGSGVEDPFAKFESSVRRAIRKAERSGVTVRFGSDLPSVRAYYRLHCRTRTRHGAPPQPFSFFRALCEHALEAGSGFVALALHRGRAIAGALFLQFGRSAIYKFSASDERFQELRGPNLVIWRSIQKLREQACHTLNFGKTSLSNDGLRRFKLGWGAEEYLIRYARYCFGQRAFVTIPDLAAGPQARLLARLPVFFSRWIGRAIYAHLT